MKNPSGFKTLVHIIGLSIISVTSFTCDAQISLDELRSQVHDYVTQQLEQAEDIQWKIEVRGLDPRIKLQNCPTAIQFRLTGKNQSIERLNTIHASCQEEEKPPLWSLFIPTQVKRMAPVVLSANSISAGQILERQDLKVEYVDTYSLRGQHYSSLSQVIGSKSRQAVRQGQVLKSRNLCQVCKGEPIIIEAVGQGLQLKTDGIALGNGVIGQSVRVQNKRSGRKISAMVVNTGRVQIKI